MIYTLDTNVLLDALRQPAEHDRLQAFLSWALPSTVLSSVVVAELTAGARSPKAREALERQFLAPFDLRSHPRPDRGGVATRWNGRWRGGVYQLAQRRLACVPGA